MTAILGIVLPVFSVMVIGFAAAKAGFFGKQACGAMTFFVFNVAIPALLFRKPATMQLPETLPWGAILSFYLVIRP